MSLKVGGWPQVVVSPIFITHLLNLSPAWRNDSAEPKLHQAAIGGKGTVSGITAKKGAKARLDHSHTIEDCVDAFRSEPTLVRSHPTKETQPSSGLNPFGLNENRVPH